MLDIWPVCGCGLWWVTLARNLRDVGAMAGLKAITIKQTITAMGKTLSDNAKKIEGPMAVEIWSNIDKTNMDYMDTRRRLADACKF